MADNTSPQGDGRGRQFLRQARQAADKAARSYQDAQAHDDKRIAAKKEAERAKDEELLAKRRSVREAELDARDAAEDEAGLKHPLLKIAQRYWTFMSAVFLALVVGFVISAATMGDGPRVDPIDGLPETGPLSGPEGQLVLATICGVLFAWVLVGTIQLWRRHPAAAGTLTSVAVIVAIPLFFRGRPLLLAVAVLMVIGAVMVWLPPVKSRLRRLPKGAEDKAAR